MSKVIQAIQQQKSTLWWFKLANWLFDYPSFKNNVFCKAFFRAFIEFDKDGLSELIKEGNCLYKKFDETDEQLDENKREFKNNLGEIIEEVSLFLKKN